MSAVIETGEKRLRVFCTAHRVSFECLGSGRIVCELGPHLLAERFPHAEVWEYCCDCRSCWPSALGQGAAAAEQCLVCARPTARRFVCAACKLVTLDSDEERRKPYAIGRGGVRPACPGCDAVPGSPLREHYCEAAKVVFVTARADCPLCGEAVVELPAFPSPLGEYLQRLEAGHIATVPVRYDAGKKALVPSPRGEFLMVKTSTSKLSIALPRARRFDSAQGFQKHYSKCYACDDPAAGEVIITYPATFSRVDGLWTLKDVGQLEVVADAPAPSDGEKVVAPPELPACVECGRAPRPGESRCGACADAFSRPDEPDRIEDSSVIDIDEPAWTFERQEPHIPANDRQDGRTGSRLWKVLAFAGGAVALVAGFLFISSRMAGSMSAEGRLRSAVERGDLVSPKGSSARDIHRQLKEGGAAGPSLAALEKQLLPKLTGAGQQIISTFATPGTPDPGLAQWGAAQEMFEWAGELAPGDADLRARAVYCRGRVFYLNGDKTTALALWKSAADLDASWALPSNGVGLIHNELGEWQKARPYLFEAVRREPTWAVPYNNLGTSFYYGRDYTQAAGYYRKAAERSPNWARPHAWLGDIAMRQQDYATAAREFEQVLSPTAVGTSDMNLDKIRQELARARQY
jgi:tetratricopeptide (TPR) repeat protein